MHLNEGAVFASTRLLGKTYIQRILNHRHCFSEHDNFTTYFYNNFNMSLKPNKKYEAPNIHFEFNFIITYKYVFLVNFMIISVSRAS